MREQVTVVGGALIRVDPQALLGNLAAADPYAPEVRSRILDPQLRLRTDCIFLGQPESDSYVTWEWELPGCPVGARGPLVSLRELFMREFSLPVGPLADPSDPFQTLYPLRDWRTPDDVDLDEDGRFDLEHDVYVNATLKVLPLQVSGTKMWGLPQLKPNMRENIGYVTCAWVPLVKLFDPNMNMRDGDGLMREEIVGEYCSRPEWMWSVYLSSQGWSD
jgi:hypothetical protein